MQSQADGIIEAAVLRLYESRRSPHLFDSGFDQKQKIKIQNALRYFEDHVALMKSPNDSADWSVAEITLICALEYLDFRFSKDHFLSTLPRLREWQAKAQQNECIQKTRPA
jgi:glutathione S-transferase